MQKMKRIMVLFLSVVMLLSTVITVCAAESTQDGIVVTLTTDRQKYEGEQVIHASVTVTNTNSFPVEGVTLEVIPPNGYAYSGPAGKQTLDILNAGAATTLAVAYNEVEGPAGEESEEVSDGNTAEGAFEPIAKDVLVTDTSTGDSAMPFLWGMLMLCSVAGIVCLCVIYRKNRKGFLSLMLCMFMLVSLLPANMLAVSAADTDVIKQISVTETVEVDGKNVSVEAVVSYKTPANNDNGQDNTDGTEGTETPGDDNGGNENTGGEDNSGSGDDDGTSGDTGSTENEEVELIINGTFEDVRENEIYKWSAVNGSWGTEFLISQDTHGDNTALGIKSTSAATYVVQPVYGVVAGETYTLKAWIKTVSLGEGGAPYIKSQFFNGTSHVANGADQLYSDISLGEWTEVSHTFTVPERANTVEILLRVYNGGEVYWDDLTMIGKKMQESDSDTGAVIKEPVGDLLIDYNFEDKTVVGNKMETSNDGSSDWTEKVKPATDTEREGTVLQIIDSGNPVTNPWVRFEVPIQPGAEYQMTAMLKTVSAGLATQNQGPVFKAEYYDAEGNHLSAEEDWKYWGSTEGEWQQVAADFSTPNETVVKARIYLRLMGAGEVYWDDVQFYMTEAAPYFTAESDFFYYADETEGSITVTTNTVAYSFDTANLYELKLVELNEDGTIKNTLASYNTSAAESFTWRFNVALLAELGKSYYILTEYKDAAGAVLASASEEVIRYNRPDMMNTEGHILEKDASGNYIADSRFHAVMGYHVWPESYEKALEIGVNVVQCPYTPKDLSAMLSLLDSAQAVGMKVLVPLYADMKPAAHEDNIENTITAIEAVKNHPALLGYMIMDEPFLSRNLEKAAGGDVDVMYEYLKESYKLIRKYDTEHIAYVCEVGEPYFAYAGRIADVLTVDPYIGGDQEKIGYKVSDDTMSAVEAVSGRKSVWTIVQAFNWKYSGDNWYLPNSNEVRSFLYQALFAGAEGLGYYRLDSFNGGDEDNKDIWEYELIDGINCFHEREFEDAVKAFITKEYTTVTESTDKQASVWYKVFEKKVGEESTYYIVVLNRYDVDATTVTIDLSGIANVAGLYAMSDDISGASALTVDTENKLTVTLSGNQVVRYKLTDTLQDDDEGGNEGGSGTGGDSGDEGGSEQEPTGLLLNGDFEAVTMSQNVTSLNNWSIGSGTWGSSVVAEGNTVFALEPNASAEQPFIKQTILNLTSGETYVLKGNIKTEDLVGTPYTRILFYKGGTSGQSVSQEAYESHSAENGVWTEFSNEFTVPAGADSAEIYLRVLKGSTATSGTLYWDDLSVTKKDVADEVSLLANGDFEVSTEAGSNNAADGWLVGAGAWGTQLNLKKQNVHAGAYALGLKPDTNYTQPFVKQTILNLSAGETYVLKGSIKIEDLVGTPYTRILFYKGGTSGQSVSQEAYEPHSAENGVWTEFTNEFTIPEGANSAEVYLRVLDGVSGALYWDDLTVELVNDPGEGDDSGNGNNDDTENDDSNADNNDNLNATGALQNGDFEAVTTAEGTEIQSLDSWSLGNNTWLWGNEFIVNSEETNLLEGLNSLGIDLSKNASNPFVRQIVSGLSPNTEYILKGYVKGADVVGTVCTKMTDCTGKNPISGSDKTQTHTIINGEWTPISHSFTTGETADGIEIYLRVLDGTGGMVYWDNLTLEKVNTNGGDNGTVTSSTILNGDFEEIIFNDKNTGTAANWTSGHAVNYTWGDDLSVVFDKGQQSNVLRMESMDAGGNDSPLVTQTITGLESGKYTLSVNLKVNKYTSNVYYKVYFDNNITQKVDGTSSQTCGFAVGSWKQTDFELTVPEDVNSATMTIRMYNDANATGHIAYWDNITIIKAE